MIKRYFPHALPTSKIDFKDPELSGVHVKVLQGEAPDPSACVQIGDCRITGLPENLPKGSPVEVVYRFDESGRISVEAEEQTGCVSAKIEIERHGALDDAKIDVLADLASTYRVE